jgi:hypothetical protein
MTWRGNEPFSNNTGQFTASVGTGTFGGTLLFTGGQGQITTLSGGFALPSYWLGAAGDPDGNDYVGLDYVSSTHPGGQSFTNMDPGFFLDADNCVVCDFGTILEPIYNFRIICIKNGVHFNIGTAAQFTLTPPFRVALSLQGNTAKFWTFQAGTWTLQQTVSVSTVFDFTVPGALAGWRPGFSIPTQPNSAVLTVDNLQWGPYSDIVSGFLYFAPTGLAGTVVNPSEIDLFWDAAVPVLGGGATGDPPGYLVFRDGVQIAWVSVFDVQSYADTTVVPGGTYVYTVAAASALGVAISPQSSPITVATHPLSVYGKFVGSRVFKAVEIGRVGEIKPRIWPSRKNNTVFS